jgi:hypothetical protein
MACGVICPVSISSDYHEEFHDWQLGVFRLHADFHASTLTHGKKMSILI